MQVLIISKKICGKGTVLITDLSSPLYKQVIEVEVNGAEPGSFIEIPA